VTKTAPKLLLLVLTYVGLGIVMAFVTTRAIGAFNVSSMVATRQVMIIFVGVNALTFTVSAIVLRKRWVMMPPEHLLVVGGFLLVVTFLAPALLIPVFEMLPISIAAFLILAGPGIVAAQGLRLGRKLYRA
jgi:hypothetical protein